MPTKEPQETSTAHGQRNLRRIIMKRCRGSLLLRHSHPPHHPIPSHPNSLPIVYIAVEFAFVEESNAIETAAITGTRISFFVFSFPSSPREQRLHHKKTANRALRPSSRITVQQTRVSALGLVHAGGLEHGKDNVTRQSERFVFGKSVLVQR